MIFATASLALLALPQAQKQIQPPGMVLIPGGNTWIGTDRAEVERAAEEAASRFMNMANETPQHQRNVESFFLGVTEVTNEQFAEFVRATKGRPPDSWGIKAIEKAGQAYALDIGTKRNAARESGQPIPTFPAFNQVQWWNDHWREAEWELPAGHETAPAGYMDFYEAQAYARWAGVRLMTEFEFQRAARGSTKNTYPWGDKWDPLLCANAGIPLKGAMPAGSYPGGASAQGVVDLSGNVWEWTSSVYEAYPGFKVMQVRRKGQVLDALVDWSSRRRVAVGGAYVADPIAARSSTRRPTDPGQSAEALGFRIAASATPGVDIAASLLARGADRFPTDVQYDATKSVTCDSWRSAPGTSKVAGYGVITGYDYVMFVPAVGLEFTSLKQLEQFSSEKAPVHVGVISTTKAMLDPALPPGTYAVALRGAGLLRPNESIRTADALVEPPMDQKQGMQEKEDPKAKPLVQTFAYPIGFNPELRNLLFFDQDMVIVGSIPLSTGEFGNPGRTSAAIADREMDVFGSGKPTKLAVTGVTLSVCSWLKTANRGLLFAIPLAFAKGELSGDWRH